MAAKSNPKQQSNKTVAHVHDVPLPSWYYRDPSGRDWYRSGTKNNATPAIATRPERPEKK